MGHEVLAYGAIVGATWRSDSYRLLQDKNERVIAKLPETDDWPWLVRGMFSLPAPWPQGTYRSQVIHFGASFKDDPTDRSCWDLWIEKLEGLLAQMWWDSASVILETELEATRYYEWLPDVSWLRDAPDEGPPPVTGWQRTLSKVEPIATPDL